RTAVAADGAAAMEALVTELRRRLAAAADGGSASAREKHRARGKLLARDRIDRLLDPRSPFLELAPLAAEGMYDGAAPAAPAGAAAVEALGTGLRRRLAAAADGGSASARAKPGARGKLLARDRIDRLLGPGSPFLEIAPLAAEGMYDGAAPGAGVVAGIG